MKKSEVIAILYSDICEEDIKNLQIVHDLSDSQIADYIERTAEFFDSFDNPELENIHIKAVFEDAVIKNNEVNIGVNKQGKMYVKRKINFELALKIAYEKNVIGFSDNLDLLEMPLSEIQMRILTKF